MNWTITYRRQARKDVAEIYDYYEARRVGLGEDFLLKHDDGIARMMNMPLASRQIWKDVRRVLLDRFPYAVFYRVLGARVIVLTVYHTRRNPAGWQGRA